MSTSDSETKHELQRVGRFLLSRTEMRGAVEMSVVPAAKEARVVSVRFYKEVNGVTTRVKDCRRWEEAHRV